MIEKPGNELISILWAILLVVLVVWILGLILDIGGSLIHLLLIVAAAILIYNLFVSRARG